MASGEVVAILSSPLQPGTAFATFRATIGGSTPAEKIHVAAFDPAINEYADFDGVLLDNYGGGGVEVGFIFGSNVTDGSFRFRAAFRAVPDDAEDLNDAHSYQFQYRSGNLPQIHGRVRYWAGVGAGLFGIRFTHGAQMDNLAAGEKFIMRFGRHATSGDDTSTGEAFLYHENLLITER